MQIAVEGREAAESWKAEAMSLNDETSRLIEEVGRLLQTVKEFADGTIIDEIYDLGTGTLTLASKITEEMNKILEVVDGLLNYLKQFFDEAGNFIKEAADLIK